MGPVLLRRLHQHFGTLATAWNATKAQLREVEGFGFQTLEKVVAQRSHLHPEQLLIQHQQENPHFWTPAEADYPRLLLETPSPPQPGPPPPCGVVNVLCMLKCMQSIPASPGRVIPSMAFMLAQSQ